MWRHVGSVNLSERIQTLHPGNHRLALPFHGDAPFELLWANEQNFDAFPELEDVEAELSQYLLLATARRSDVLLPILVSKAPPHPTFVFFEGFHPLAESLEAFAKKLSQAEQVAPAERLRASLDEVSGVLDAGRYSDAAEKLELLLSPYRAPQAAGDAALATQLGRGFTDLGFAWHKLGDDAKAASAYELGAKFGSFSAGKNLLTMHREAGDWTAARARAEALLQRFSSPEELNQIRINYAIALAMLGDAAVLQKLSAEHIDYLKWLANREVDKAKSLRDEFLAQLEALRADPVTRTMIEPFAAALTQLSLIGKPKEASDRDVARVLEAIQKKQELKFKNWLQSKPALAEDPRIIEAVGALAEPTASAFQRILSGMRSQS